MILIKVVEVLVRIWARLLVLTFLMVDAAPALAFSIFIHP
jgi:hypothetical protein